MQWTAFITYRTETGSLTRELPLDHEEPVSSVIAAQLLDCIESIVLRPPSGWPQDTLTTEEESEV